ATETRTSPVLATSRRSGRSGYRRGGDTSLRRIGAQVLAHTAVYTHVTRQTLMETGKQTFTVAGCRWAYQLDMDGWYGVAPPPQLPSPLCVCTEILMEMAERTPSAMTTLKRTTRYCQMVPPKTS